ncbi:MAG: hypothetical protein E4G94_07810 [ANME-2 cluster archaeon]|nr:MAG: hypothetical protein E4G94_07810 [ANME-2 cluster archaeon]
MDTPAVLLALLFGSGNTKYVVWGVALTMLFKSHTLHPLPVRAAGWQPAMLIHVAWIRITENAEKKHRL